LAATYWIIKTDETGTVSFSIVRSALRGAVNIIGDGSTYEADGQFISMDDVTEVDVVCTNASGEPLETIYLDSGAAGYAWVHVPIQPGDSIECRWYNIRSTGDEPVSEIDFRTYVVNCDDDPGVVSEANGNIPPDGCALQSGAWISISSEDGSLLGECVTGEAGFCDLALPDQTDVVVTEDVDTVPSGYTPRDNSIQTRAETEFAGAVFVNLPAELATDEPNTELIEPTETPEPIGRPTHIHAGVCGELKDSPRFDLEDITTASPTSSPTPGATPDSGIVEVEVSRTVIDVSLADLLASPFAINVHLSREATKVQLVCGNIGGDLRQDGSISVGLSALNNSGFVGVAYLRPVSDNPDQTEVLVFLFAEDSLATPVATPMTP